MKKSMFISTTIVSVTALTTLTMAVLPDKKPGVDLTPAVQYEAPSPIKQKYVCENCNVNEAVTLSFLQDRGIEDKAALATVMGNIKQESNFITNICEGGARVSYQNCLRGGYGLIQWTTENRYLGLGLFAKKYNGNPDTLLTQLRYMVNEPEWMQYELYLKSEGQSIDFYMKHAYNWLGWGIHGNRTRYSYKYYNQIKNNVNTLA